MKLKYLLIVLLINIFTFGCSGGSGTDNNSTEKQQLASSLVTWKKEKDRNGSSYKYVVNFQSWVGFGSETTIIVINNQVVERHYLAWDNEQNQTESWDEISHEELGIHDYGAPLKLIEDLYEECSENVLTESTEDNHIYIDFFDSGLLKTCSYFPNQCADDCSQGVSIDDLEFF